MTTLQTLQVLAIVLTMAVGQTLFKVAATQVRGHGLGLAWSLATNPWLFVALCLYAATTIAWVLVLRDVPLSRAYPLTALGMVAVPLIGLLVFRETASWSLAIGGALMLIGAYIIVR